MNLKSSKKREMEDKVIKLLYIYLGIPFSIFILIRMLGFDPYYSSTTLILAAINTFLLIVIIVVYKKSGNMWAQGLAGNSILVYFLISSFRFLSFYLKYGVVIFGIGLIIYIFAWFLPVINWELSSLLLREQFSPKTKIGKGCMNLGLLAMSFGGTTAYWVTKEAREAGKLNWVGIFIGTGLLVICIILGQSFSQQIFEGNKRKIKNQEGEGKE